MTLQKDEPKQPMPLSQKIIWAVTLTVAGGGIIAAVIVLAVSHVKLF